MEPFDPALVPGLLTEALHERAAELTELSPPIAAASIAQVHKAVLVDATASPRTSRSRSCGRASRQRVPRRPRELLCRRARWPSAGCRRLRRLRPTDVVKTLDRSARLELDLRLEAASISEMAENIKDDDGLRHPERELGPHGARRC